jgi:two-component system, OmpR family, copper resistance phosphate regulon response regulator CusR
MPSILLVEDDLDIAGLIKNYLENEKYQVTHFDSGLRARVSRVSDFDLVLLDWMLPDIMGIDILRYWQRQNFITPIIFLTAKSDLQSKVLGLDYGAVDYITKPFEWGELLARIRSKINNKNIAKVGSIIFNRETECFSENNKAVNLTKKEYQILEYFFNNPHKLVSRSQLITHLYDSDPFSNVIERHIKSIRSKFNYDPISTTRGLGYRLRLS